MFEVLHHGDGNDANRTPRASVSRIIDASEFGELGEPTAEILRKAEFLEIGMCADLRSNDTDSEILFGVQALINSGYSDEPYCVIALQGGGVKRAKSIDEIDREDMPPWQAAMDGTPVDPDSVDTEKWDALQILSDFAWLKITAAIIEANDEGIIGTPSDDRSPLRGYLYR